MNGGITSETNSAALAQHFGGRFVYLNSCILLHKLLIKHRKSEEKIVSKDCNLFITDRRRLDQTKVLLTTPKADMVLLEISKYDEMVVSEVLDGKGAND